MTAPDVWARPDRLSRFRHTAEALADGLQERRRSSGAASMAHLAGTERRYEVDCGHLLALVEELAEQLRALGRWVGRVGDAFEGFTVAEGIAFGRGDALLEAVPLGPALVFARFAATPGSDGGPGLDVLARDLLTARVLVNASGPVLTLAQLTSLVTTARAGMVEVAHRWHADEGLPGAERVGRASMDGVLNMGGGLAGGALGAAAAGTACGGPSNPAGASCAAVGTHFGANLGQRAGEAIGDLFMGDERASWERDPVGLAGEIADVDDAVVSLADARIDEVVADVTERAQAHADHVMGHPWIWADTYRDAPVHAPPPPPPAIPARGPV
jgi:hypothetical protein